MKKRVVMLIQGAAIQGDLPDGMTVETALSSGEELTLGNVVFMQIAGFKALPSMQVKTALIGAIGEDGPPRTASDAMAIGQAAVNALQNKGKPTRR